MLRGKKMSHVGGGCGRGKCDRVYMWEGRGSNEAAKGPCPALHNNLRTSPPQTHIFFGSPWTSTTLAGSTPRMRSNYEYTPRHCISTHTKIWWKNSRKNREKYGKAHNSHKQTLSETEESKMLIETTERIGKKRDRSTTTRPHTESIEHTNNRNHINFRCFQGENKYIRNKWSMETAIILLMHGQQIQPQKRWLKPTKWWAPTECPQSLLLYVHFP